MTVLLGNIHVHMLTWSGWAFSILISWLDLLYLLEFGIYGLQLPSLLVCWSCKCVRNVEHSFWLVQQFVHRQVVELLLLLELLQAETCKLTVYQICFFDFWSNAALRLWFWSNAFLRIDVWVFLLEYIFDLLQKMVRTLVNNTYTFLQIRKHLPDELEWVMVEEHTRLRILGVFLEVHHSFLQAPLVWVLLESDSKIIFEMDICTLSA